MAEALTTKKPTFAFVLALIGGLVAAAGSVLRWATVDVELAEAGLPAQREVVSGLDTSDGKVFLIIGVVVAGLAVMSWLLRSMVARRVLGVLMVVAAGFTVWGAAVDLVDIEDQGLRGIAEQFASQNASVNLEVVLEQLRAFVSISPGIGLYLVIGGAAVALAGGAWTLISPGGERSAPAPLPPPLPSLDEPPSAGKEEPPKEDPLTEQPGSSPPTGEDRSLS
ncbi:MAG: hypothetical protein ACRDH6_09345 [Actinomycetota bacterium]